ncbi:MAG: SigE family RNA polymerase sigma factor [bacterium]|nr:SigE family RNA polymerase sigma factor [bacterium]MCY4194983.1 SigE family RNA polymerase sigma factor [bacterium]MCY4272341.1 SigE family RNA polymerase sigma factor [bacterium]
MNSGVSESEQPISPPAVPAGEVYEVAAFDDLYRREYEPMVRLARGLVDTTEFAEEVVQDAFAKVLDRWGRLDRPGAYLRTAVVNGARSELRKREVRRRVGLRPFAAPEPGESDYLLDALNQLSNRQKTALVLKFYADMSEKEIAQAMGVRPGTVKSATARGLAELRKAIKR